MLTRTACLTTVALALTGCAPQNVIERPSGYKEICFLKDCYEQAMRNKEEDERIIQRDIQEKERVAEAERSIAAQKKADQERQAKQEAETAAFKAKFPCELPTMYGVAVGMGSLQEYKNDAAYLVKMATVRPLRCNVGALWYAACSGFYFGQQPVQIRAAPGADGLVTIMTSVPLNVGNVTALLYVDQQYLSCQ